MDISFIALPPEIITKIYLFLDDTNLVNVSITCKLLREIYFVDYVWEHRCKSIWHPQGTGLTALPTRGLLNYYTLYTKVLIPYGHFLGYWNLRPEDDFLYGRLCSVTLVDGKLVGTLFHGDGVADISRGLCQYTLFTVEVHSHIAKVYCWLNQNGKHDGKLTKGEGKTFKFCCCDVIKHMPYAAVLTQSRLDVMDRLQLDDVDFLAHYVRIKFDEETKFIVHRGSTIFKKLELFPSCMNKPLAPGLFKGTYGCHGMEIVHLSYDETNQNAVGLKITGDPNVPQGQITFIADLKRPMVLTAPQQVEFNTLMALDTGESSEGNSLHNLPRQSFIVPDGCRERAPAPNHCIARYHAKGQVAHMYFKNPTYTHSHWIVFDEDTFGQLWLRLESLSIYKRLKNDDLNVHMINIYAGDCLK